MKLIILPLIIASIGIAEASVYKCPGKLEGRYTYQEKPCSKKEGAADKNEVKIIPTDKKRVEEAVEKLNKDIKIHQAKKDKKSKTIDKNQTEIKVTMPPREKYMARPAATKNENQESSSDDNNEGG
jgi:hypothetical protein